MDLVAALADRIIVLEKGMITFDGSRQNLFSDEEVLERAALKKPAVFIDRDGTVNEQMGYINHVSRFKVLPGVPEAITLLNENGYHAIVISNHWESGRLAY